LHTRQQLGAGLLTLIASTGSDVIGGGAPVLSFLSIQLDERRCCSVPRALMAAAELCVQAGTVGYKLA